MVSVISIFSALSLLNVQFSVHEGTMSALKNSNCGSRNLG